MYTNITDNLHVSGHGSQQDLLMMMALTRPKYLVPIGGTYRHMVQYSRLAQSMGYQPSQVLLPEFNQSLEMSPDGVKLGPIIEVKNVMVDGLGVGDVGHIVLRDRQVLAEEGIVVAVVETDQTDLSKVAHIDLISRGFVFAKENTQLFNQASELLKQAIIKRKGHLETDRHVREVIADILEHFFFDKTGRRPMILPVVVEV